MTLGSGSVIRQDLVRAHRARALSPEAPMIRGTAHNVDTFFQARETANPYYARVPGIVQAEMDRFAALTGRAYKLFEYDGPADAERVIVVMGTGAQTARETAKHLARTGDSVGVLQVRLFRPFAPDYLIAALPPSTRAIAVLEQSKEVGASGEPLYCDVVVALAQAVAAGTWDTMPRVIGGRYGLGSKNFNPAQVKAVFDELKKPDPKNGFTVGIDDDVSHASLQIDPDFSIEPDDVVRAVFYGLGSDGTVGANKNSVKIIAEEPAMNAQGYFVYDSHKSGAQTISHLRFGKRPIKMPYLIESANFVACHQSAFLDRLDMLKIAAPGGSFLLNTPHGPQDVWDTLPRTVQDQIVAKHLRFYVIDASKVARDSGLGGRINTVLQTCFFAISGVMPHDDAIACIKHAIEKSYGAKGADIVQRNFQAVENTLAQLFEVDVPATATSTIELPDLVPADAPRFVREVTVPMMQGRGDTLRVSQMPVDGTFPSGTAAFEKRNVSDLVAVWDADLCIQCGQCSFVCPHSVIRSKYFNQTALDTAPEGFKSAPINSRGNPDIGFTLEIYLEDCTGCALCVEACPVHAPQDESIKAINLGDKAPILATARENIAFFETLPVNDRGRVDFANVQGVQYLQPLFEFSAACAGCGETPYLKLLSQLFGDRLQIANATGCSSIYGGNLPVTPWTRNAQGRGPAWSNSLFEDNAEFGLGFRLAADKHLELAETALARMAPELGEDLVRDILDAPQVQDSDLQRQRVRVSGIKTRLAAIDSEAARDLLSVIDHLVRRSIWIVGGDGWAYDIGYGGLDHVLATDRDVNVLVLDTEVYSNTGGQASKATPLGAVAKFAAGGKRVARKDLGMQAIAYGNVYVAQVAMGANPQQTLLAFREAEAYPGPSLILAYSHCIAHGFDMRDGMKQQDLATASGYWPLFRYNPTLRGVGEKPFQLDSPRPTIPFKAYAYNELRYRSLATSDPAAAEMLLAHAQQVVTEKYHQYEELAGRGAARFHPDSSDPGADA